MTTLTAPHPGDLDDTPACHGVDTETFFPLGNAVLSAVKICKRCPLMQPCLDYALAHDVHGVWGGTTREQRRQLRLTLGLNAQPVQAGDVTAAPAKPRNTKPRPRPAKPTQATATAPAEPVKKCPRCRNDQPVSAYYRNRSNPDGLATWCKPCFADIANRPPKGATP